MSRIGKAPIGLPKGVEITISDKNLVTVKGPKGTLSQAVDPAIRIKQEGGEVILERPTDAKPHRAMHGLYRALLANMVKGVSEGFVVEQELVGVGYRATAKGQQLQLALGFSHGITLVLPSERRQAAAGPSGRQTALAAQTRAVQGQGCPFRERTDPPQGWQGRR
jgi:large subunit ribosomal protein L6